MCYNYFILSLNMFRLGCFFKSWLAEVLFRMPISRDSSDGKRNGLVRGEIWQDGSWEL